MQQYKKISLLNLGPNPNDVYQVIDTTKAPLVSPSISGFAEFINDISVSGINVVQSINEINNTLSGVSSLLDEILGE